MTDSKIAEARITPLESRIPSFDSGVNEVFIRYENDVSFQKLFQYYTDELTFTPEEFAGLTVKEARKLHYDRDMAYLRS